MWVGAFVQHDLSGVLHWSVHRVHDTNRMPDLLQSAKDFTPALKNMSVTRDGFDRV